MFSVPRNSIDSHGQEFFFTTNVTLCPSSQIFQVMGPFMPSFLSECTFLPQVPFENLSFHTFILVPNGHGDFGKAIKISLKGKHRHGCRLHFFEH